MRQLKLIKNQNTAYGGDLLKTRKGRSRPRPLATKHSMHLVLRSTQAKGPWSFRSKTNARNIDRIVDKFSQRYSVKIHSLANAGNHLHFHIQLAHRSSYRPFIRALTAAIAMSITRACRWRPAKIKFWDRRPFSRVVFGWKGIGILKDYLQINRLEGFGYPRDVAQEMVRAAKWPAPSSA